MRDFERKNQKRENGKKELKRYKTQRKRKKE